MGAEIQSIKLLLTKSISIGIDEALLEIDKLGHIWKMYFHRADQVYLSIENQMIDLEERKEEGQLILSEIDNLDESRYLRICFPKTLGKSGAMYLFFSQDERNTQPCGFRIVDIDNIVHDVLVGAAPNSLVFMTPYYEEKKASEYPIEYYSLINIFN